MSEVHQTYIERDPFVVSSVELGDFRTVVNVPMLKENELVGAIAIYRSGGSAVHRKADRAAYQFRRTGRYRIENTRLLNELRQRTDDLSESLEQQTATSEVLKVISSSASRPAACFRHNGSRTPSGYAKPSGHISSGSTANSCGQSPPTMSAPRTGSL